MSEAELHLLHGRMRGGLLNKAKRGELRMYLPVGLAYDTVGHVILEPDTQVQQAVHLVFETFRRTGSALSVVRTFREQGLRFPRHVRGGPQHAELMWKDLSYSMLSRVLHNPRYAGAFVFGRTKSRRALDGKGHATTRLPQDQWQVVIHNAHPGYISWEQYEANVARLHENATACGLGDRKGAPREGPALLQGLILCGVCGQRMHPRYAARRRHVWPYYSCPRQDTEGGKLKCQHIAGHAIDEAVATLLIQSMTPLALELALSVQQEIQLRIEEADRLRRIQVDRARYEVNLAQRRYLQVDPENRMVAGCLEADWNHKLQRLAEAQQEYERQRQADGSILEEQQRERILALATDFRQLWQDPNTPQRERKRMARLLIEDVTVIKNEMFLVHVRFKGGATETITVTVPKSAWQKRRTPAGVIAEIDRLLNEHPPYQIADILNQRGNTTADGKQFTATVIDALLRHHGLKSRHTRLREAGLLTLPEMASLLRASESEIWRRRKQGKLLGCAYGNNKYLYQPVGVSDAINLLQEM